MLPDSQVPDITFTAPRGQPRKLAPIWHTAVLVLLLLAASFAGSRSLHPLATHGKLLQYIWTGAWEWLLVGFVYLGIRKRCSLRQLIGLRWQQPEDFLRDMAIAAGFWIVAMVVLGSGAKLMHLDQGSQLETMRKQLGFLIPGTTAELLAWLALSATAGFCEEIVFRGYLQRQFASFAGSTLVGTLLSAVIFGAAHGYEGGARMMLIAIFGLLFGLLAWWRGTLVPGMMAHAWHDALSGAVLRLLK